MTNKNRSASSVSESLTHAAFLSSPLVDAGEQVRDVPPKLSAGVRKLAGSGHKTDADDAHSTPIAGRHATVLRTVEIDHDVELLALLVERGWHIVDTRQKTLVRIHEQLTKLQPGGYSKKLSADKVAGLLRSIAPPTPSRHVGGRSSRSCWSTFVVWTSSASRLMPNSTRPWPTTAPA